MGCVKKLGPVAFKVKPGFCPGKTLAWFVHGFKRRPLFLLLSLISHVAQVERSAGRKCLAFAKLLFSF